MKERSLKEDLIARIESLPPHLQSKVLELVRNLVPQGVQGRSLLRFEGAIPSEDLDLMRKVIEDNCEKVDLGEW